MSTPWIETKKYPDQSNLARSGSEYTWQAMFACQVKILPHQEWVKMRWGFNASALFDEALERQKLFLTSQHEAKGGLSIENLDHRTLAFRYITRPSDGLLVTVLAKILGRTQVEADHKALAYYREIKSTFPYDYSLVPAASKDDFIYFTGEDILEDVNT
ncbi:MAG TPA: hypothetical protein VLA72_11980, partial [Anaerolineales bacterium]|nr:hypothetical protein [Anaerolineales bacterium]